MNQMAMNSMLEFSVMRPILNSLNRSLGLSDMSVEFNENGYMTVRLARALNKKETVLMRTVEMNSMLPANIKRIMTILVMMRMMIMTELIMNGNKMFK